MKYKSTASITSLNLKSRIILLLEKPKENMTGRVGV